jgi:glycosyltransferase involved in cell wall biosynthesis
MRRRILVLNERDLRNPLAGGAEVHVFEIFKRLARRGHEITLLAASFPGCEREEEVDGVHVRRLANRYLYYGLVPWVARREFRRGGYDLVVDTLNKLPFLSPWFVGRPSFAIVHHLFGTTAFRQVPLPIALVTWLSEKLIPAAYRGVPMLAISPSTKADLVARGLDARQIWVVPPGVDDAYSAPATGALSEEGLVVWIGRLEPYKRADLMLDAMVEIRRQVRESRLVVVGEGSARSALEERARRLGMSEHVRFTGFVSEPDKIGWLRRAAVLVNTSEKEGWGMTVIEGNACGVPSVSTDVPGLRDAVRDADTGLLVPYGDARALAAGVIRVLTDAVLRERMVVRSLQWAARFRWDQVADDTEALFDLAIVPRAVEPRLVASPFSG